LWLLPLIVVFLEPGRVLGFKLAPSTAWLIFSGTTALAYMFFIVWRVVAWSQVAEFAPLYLLLLLPEVRAGLAWLAARASGAHLSPRRAEA